MENYDRLSILVSIVLLGLVLTFIIELPTTVIQGTLFGSPITLTLSTRVFMVILLSALTAIGTEYIMRAHPDFEQQGITGYSFLFWILPTFVTMIAATFIPLLVSNLFVWLFALGLTAIMLSAVIVAEYRSINPKDSAYMPVRLFLNLVTYLSGLLLFTAIYRAKLRSVLSASGVLFISTLLALALLRAERDATAQTWTYALICGLILAEATWALNYWGVGGVAGGGLLLLLFYFLAGISQHHLLNRFNRTVLIEFALVGTIGIIVLATQGALSW